LHKKIKETTQFIHPLSLLQRLRMARHCSLGILVLHKNRIIHRDIKSMNVLVTEDYSCKITDFGCAKLLDKTTRRANIHQTARGTPLWMAPEVAREADFGFPADIYSLGVMLFEIFERDLPVMAANGLTFPANYRVPWGFKTCACVRFHLTFFSSQRRLLPLVSNMNRVSAPLSSKWCKWWTSSFARA